jgi:hypothetical protein
VSRGKTQIIIWAALAIIVWGWCFWFHISAKTSLLDDCFIYLHIANNILEKGSAQYFPVTDNPAFLASSPLRVLLLVPSAAAAKLLLEPDRSIETVRITLLLSGLITSLIFLLFYRRNLTRWLTGCVFAALICLCTESGLQMEGLFLFWTLFTFIHICSWKPKSRSYFVSIGILVGLLGLSRPEYGVVGFLFLLVYVARFRSLTYLFAYLLPIMTGALLWIIIAFLWGVYPIPTTYVAKVITAEKALFTDGSFMDVFFMRIASYFVKAPSAIVLAYIGLMAVVVATRGVLYRCLLVFIALSFLIVMREAGNYIWYHENLYIIVVTVCFCVLLDTWKFVIKWKFGRRNVILPIVLMVPILLFFKNTGRDHVMTWNFRADKSRGLAYEAIGKSYVGEGLYKFSGMPPCYLQMHEIGISSYFAGSDGWLLDAWGLVQPGLLKKEKDHVLFRFYPDSVLRLPSEEYQLIKRKFGHQQGEYSGFTAFGDPSPQHIHQCGRYLSETGICLVAIPTDS